MPVWSIRDIPSQTGRLAAVTGATGGLGYETALGLAQAGAEVILLGRNEEKGRVALQRIRQLVSAAKVRFERIDLSSMTSVQECSARLLKQGRGLDVLVNNAGVMAPPKRQVTVDGFELQFATNHLSHFLLTAELLPLLRLSAAPRVVNVSSSAARMGSMTFDDLQSERSYKPFPVYSQSKLANLLFTFELQRRSEAKGWGLLSDAAHPGYAVTDLITNGPGDDSLMNRYSAALLKPFLSQSAAAGALPTLYGATSPLAKPMGYYGPDGLFELKGNVHPAVIPGKAKDLEAARRLWDVSVELTGARWAGTMAS
jgi:NAD(P)-dependent dehydrogenase (short-subunit alcohol dehydrogenase family)